MFLGRVYILPERNSVLCFLKAQNSVHCYRKSDFMQQSPAAHSGCCDSPGQFLLLPTTAEASAGPMPAMVSSDGSSSCSAAAAAAASPFLAAAAAASEPFLNLKDEASLQSELLKDHPLCPNDQVQFVLLILVHFLEA